MQGLYLNQKNRSDGRLIRIELPLILEDLITLKTHTNIWIDVWKWSKSERKKHDCESCEKMQLLDMKNLYDVGDDEQYMTRGII